MLLKVDIIHSTSHFNKKPKFIFLERGGKRTFQCSVWRLLSSARAGPQQTPFLLRCNGSSEASVEMQNQHAGKSAGCVRTGLDKIHPKHSPYQNTTKNRAKL